MGGLFSLSRNAPVTSHQPDNDSAARTFADDLSGAAATEERTRHVTADVEVTDQPKNRSLDDRLRATGRAGDTETTRVPYVLASAPHLRVLILAGVLIGLLVLVTGVGSAALYRTTDPSNRGALWLLLGVAGVSLIAGLVLARFSFLASRIQFREYSRRRVERRAEAERAVFEANIAQGLDMAQSEEAAIEVVELILRDELSGAPAEMLVADSSHAHLAQVLTTDDDNGGPGCEVSEPGDCPAIRRGTSLTFHDGGSYAACPHLRNRPGPACSAACVPVNIAGRTVGVVHTTSTNGDAPSASTVSRIAELSDRVGDRIGVLRAFARSQTQAATDSLTGLLNRRSFENQVSEMLSRNEQIAIAFGDLDQFKNLNDAHGHDAGDRALRLFARVIKESVREMDASARWGGEEFVIMFAHSDARTAARTLSRLQQNLTIALASGTTPSFTVSFGVADHLMADSLEDILALADSALLSAKRGGRNQVVVAGRDRASIEGDAPTAPGLDGETSEPQLTM